MSEPAPMGTSQESPAQDSEREVEHVVPFLDLVDIALVLHDRNGAVALATRSAAALFGVEPRDLEGRPLGAGATRVEAPDGTLLEVDDLPCMRAIRTGRVETDTVVARDDDGAERWIELDSKPLGLLTGDRYEIATTLVDVTEHHERERLLSIDDVTGLGNRMLASEHLQRALARADRRRAAVAVMFVDLDQFKQVNDAFGHAAGDHVLRDFAGRLRAVVRATDFVGRLGGDEFLVVAGDVERSPDGDAEPADHAAAVAEAQARRILAALDEPLSVGESSRRLGASIGIAIYPAHGRDVDELLRNADTAMYAAKAAGRGCVRFFEPAA